MWRLNSLQVCGWKEFFGQRVFLLFCCNRDPDVLCATCLPDDPR